MNIFYKKQLSDKIKQRKAELVRVTIQQIDKYLYCLSDQSNNRYTLNIDFVGMDPMPSTGDAFYLSENMTESFCENLYTFTFSTKIGEVYARPPHDFLKKPEEFMIFEYKNGKTILLEQWYR